VSFQPVVAWILTGLLCMLAVTSGETARGAIPPNHWFGIRLRPLLRSPAAWRAGHAAAVAPATIAFAVTLAVAVLGSFVPISGVAIATFIAGVAWTFVRASRAASRT